MHNLANSNVATTQEALLGLLRYLMDSQTSEGYFDKVDQFRLFDRQLTTKGLCELLSHSDPAIRGRAGEVLLQINAQAALEPVLSLLKDPVEHIREGICDLLCGYGDYRAVDVLIEVLLHDSSSDVRFNAAVALGNIGDERAIPVLEEVVQNDFAEDFQGVTVSSAAKQAIERIRNPLQLS